MNEEIKFKETFITEKEMKERYGLKVENYPDEEFKLLVYENVKLNKYYISSYGRLFTVYGRQMRYVECTINPNVIYYNVLLQCDGFNKERNFFVHRLVAFMFIPKTPDDILNGRDYINHKYILDGRCNYVWNLEWLNDPENLRHRREYIPSQYDFDVLFMNNFETPSFNGETNPKARLTESQVDRLCYNVMVLGMSKEDAARDIGLDFTNNSKDRSVIYSIINGYCWHTVSSKYGIVTKQPKHYPKVRTRDDVSSEDVQRLQKRGQPKVLQNAIRIL